MKVTARVENIFAHAVAMDSRGLRNTIHCVGTNVFIVNFDHSMILRFPLRRSELQFPEPVSFNANDYDSADFDVVDGKIVFKTVEGDYERRKACSLANYDVHEIRRIYHQLISAATDDFVFYLSKDVCSLLDEQLSHVELAVVGHGLQLCQRNVYTGTVIQITPRRKGAFDVDESKLPEVFGPVGLKTKDFTSLFAFCDSLAFHPTADYLVVKDHARRDFDGVLALCKYDEMINLFPTEANNGWQES